MSTHRLERSQIYAGAVGNVLEWYDFAVYGFLAPLIGKIFPSDDPVTSLLAAYGVFAVGYASRPLGSILFGHLGDRIGRKPALILSMAMMGSATLAIALLPGHGEIGATAAVLLLVLRFLQGISVAGEYGTSAVLLVERAPAGRRGLVGGWVMAACNLGFLLGSAVAALVSTLLGDAAMAAWGWRIPFLLGAVIAVHVLFMRRKLEESPLAVSREAAATLPVVEALRDHWRAIGQIVCLVMPTAVIFFMCFVYASSFLTERMHVSTATALDITTLALVLQVVIAPAAGLLADRVGRRPVMLFVTIAGLLTAWPLWFALHQQSLAWIVFAQLAFALINGIGWALTVPIMVELAPARIRCSVSGIAYNLCLALFGGTTPWVATWLVARTADDFAPVWYIMATALVALIATLRMPEMAGKRCRRRPHLPRILQAKQVDGAARMVCLRCETMPDFEARKRQLLEDGCCVVPGVLAPAETDRVRERLWAAAGESERLGVPTRQIGLDPNEHNIRVFYLLERDAIFRELIQHPTAIEFVTTLLGPDFLISNFTANIALPGSQSMELHSDQGIVVPEPWFHPWSINIIWCLNDVDEENGATRYVPGSHKIRWASELPEDARARSVPFQASAGSIAVMDGRLWHTSGANVSQSRERALLFGYYSRSFIRQQQNWNASLSPETLDALSPQLRTWLGLEARANVKLAQRLRIHPVATHTKLTS